MQAGPYHGVDTPVTSLPRHAAGVGSSQEPDFQFPSPCALLLQLNRPAAVCRTIDEPPSREVAKRRPNLPIERPTVHISTNAFCTIDDCAPVFVRSNAEWINSSPQGGMTRSASIRSAVRLVQCRNNAILIQVAGRWHSRKVQLVERHLLFANSRRPHWPLGGHAVARRRPAIPRFLSGSIELPANAGRSCRHSLLGMMRMRSCFSPPATAVATLSV